MPVVPLVPLVPLVSLVHVVSLVPLVPVLSLGLLGLPLSACGVLGASGVLHVPVVFILAIAILIAPVSAGINAMTSAELLPISLVSQCMYEMCPQL